MIDTEEPHAPGSSSNRLLERLNARHAARESERQARAAAAQVGAAPREDVNGFLLTFGIELKRLADLLVALQAPGTIDTQLLEVDEVASQLAVLEQSTADAAYFLPPFELRRVTTQLQELRAGIAAAKAAAAPPRRFAFSRRVAHAPAPTTLVPAQQQLHQKPRVDCDVGDIGHRGGGGSGSSGSAANAPASSGWPPGQPSPQDAALIAAGRGASRLQRRSIVLRGADLADCGGYVLHALEDCSVMLLGRLDGLRLCGLRRCSVMAAPVCGAVYVSGAVDCTLMLACHQVRVHDAAGCDLYLAVRSHPVIEACTALRFAPLAAEQMLLLDILKGTTAIVQEDVGSGDTGDRGGGAGSSSSSNADHSRPPSSHNTNSLVDLMNREGLCAASTGEQWRCVDDFGWVKSGPSPNWTLLPHPVGDSGGDGGGGGSHPLRPLLLQLPSSSCDTPVVAAALPDGSVPGAGAALQPWPDV